MTNSHKWIFRIFQGFVGHLGFDLNHPPGATGCGAELDGRWCQDSGAGASIGSVTPRYPENCVRNVTWRNISMPHTTKGVYIKSNPGC